MTPSITLTVWLGGRDRGEEEGMSFAAGARSKDQEAGAGNERLRIKSQRKM